MFLYRERAAGDLEFLLFKRVERADLNLPAFWQGVSGALEHSESVEQAAIREVFEESRIQIDAAMTSGFIHTYPILPAWRIHYGPEPTHIEEHVCFSKLTGNTTPHLSQEHQEWAWCREADALSRLSFGQNREALRSVIDALASTLNSHAQ